MGTCKKVKGTAKEHIPITHQHEQWWGDGLRTCGGLGGGGQRGKNWDNSNSINNKMFFEKGYLDLYIIY